MLELKNHIAKADGIENAPDAEYRLLKVQKLMKVAVKLVPNITMNSIS